MQRISKCRICDSTNLTTVLSLGEQALTGVFPESSDVAVTVGPLELVWCADSGLLQLAHTYSADEMYGENYGYRSGLNQSMVQHLTKKIHKLETLASLTSGGVVLDIGSNDSTSLRAYRTSSIERIGIDPTGEKFKSFYPGDVRLIADFFSAENFQKASTQRAKIITSIAMFYDLEEPIEFARDIARCLAPDGIWHLEQSYMPSMLRMTSYDTICHEHIEYYSLDVVEKILDAADLRVLDVQMNSVNGGSFAITAGHKAGPHICNAAVLDWLKAQENSMGLDTPRPYREFEDRVFRHRSDLRRLLLALRDDGKRVLGYGAIEKEMPSSTRRSPTGVWYSLTIAFNSIERPGGWTAS